jgi:hypothetical protein
VNYQIFFRNPLQKDSLSVGCVSDDVITVMGINLREYCPTLSLTPTVSGGVRTGSTCGGRNITDDPSLLPPSSFFGEGVFILFFDMPTIS